jgi:hypothetical protein
MIHLSKCLHVHTLYLLNSFGVRMGQLIQTAHQVNIYITSSSKSQEPLVSSLKLLKALKCSLIFS